MREKLLAYIRLTRPDTVGIPFLIGVTISYLYSHMAHIYDMARIVLFGFLFASLQAFGQTTNQIFDLPIDMINKPYRPIPSGQISIVEAKTIALIIFVLGVVFSALISLTTLMMYLITTLLTLMYRPELRRINAYLTLFYLGVMRGVLPVLIVAVTYNICDLFTALYATICFMWVFAFQGTKDPLDVRGDKIFGIKTLPVVYGERWVEKFFWLTIIAVVVILSVSWFVFPLTIPIVFVAVDVFRRTVYGRYRSAWYEFYFGLFMIHVTVMLCYVFF